MKPIDELLSEMMARNASDLHIKAGSPPVLRVDGDEAYRNEESRPVPLKSVEQQSLTALHRLRSGWSRGTPTGRKT